MWLDFITFILASYGMTFILMRGTILDGIRPNWEILKCPACTGFWVGMFLFVVFEWCEAFLFNSFIVGVPVFGCVAAGTCYVLMSIFDDLGIAITTMSGGDYEEEIPTNGDRP